MEAYFDDEYFTFTIDGEEITALEAKGASAGVARDAAARLSIIIQRLSNDVITLQEAYDGYKRETKLMHMAEFAFANGGVASVKDWGPVEELIAEQWNGNNDFPGMRAFFEDIERGRYGTGQLTTGALARGLSYTNAGRATYENERVAAQMRLRETEAKRVQGGVEKHCPDCPAWAALGWIEAALMYARYAIGMSRCNVGCYCVIVTRRAAVDAKNAIGKNAVLALLQTVAKARSGTAAGAGALLAAFALLRFARNNPEAFSYALGLLIRALEPQRI